ncbi:POU domain, class 6, transcription factor 2 isoform 1-T1 [Ctenodactylus gundi]
MIAGQVRKPLLSAPTEMNVELRGEDKAATSDSELNEPLLAPLESNDSEDTPSKLFGARGTAVSDPGTPDQHSAGQPHPPFPVGPQPLLTAQQLASAVAGVMPGGPPALNQPILIPFNMAGQLGGQQGLVLTLPTANLTNIQGLVAAAAAGGIMTLPLQNLQATSSLNSQLQQLQQLQHLQQQQQQQQQQPAPPPASQQPQPTSQSQQTQPQSTPSQQPPPASQSLPAPASQLPQAPQSQQHPPHSHPQNQNQPSPTQQSSSPPQKPSQSPGHSLSSPLTPPNPLQLVNNPLASQAAAAAAMGSLASSQAFGNALSSLQGVTGQLVTNAQGQIIGTIPLMPNPGPSSQAASSTQGLQVQPITPQLLTNAQGQIIATVIGNQILPVINTQGITLSPIKPGQQLHQPSQTSVGPAASQGSLLQLAHGQASVSQSPGRQPSSSSSSSPSSALSVGQLVSNPQTATGEVDGVNLEEIREFAKAFKIRRLSLGLTQTQVGQALSATEGPAYSQSAICRHTILRSHFFLPQEAQENTIASSLTAKLNPGLLYPARFEKLDITPKSAQKIKPVLERWMAEAEARHRAGMQNLTEFIGSEPSKKRKRRTSFTPQALEILNAHFEKNTHPSGQEMTEIAEKLNYDREVVRVWFCNKRQALKNTIKRLKQHEPASAVPLEPLTDSLEENS